MLIWKKKENDSFANTYLIYVACFKNSHFPIGFQENDQVQNKCKHISTFDLFPTCFAKIIFSS